MKKRFLTLLLATSPIKAKADTLTIAPPPSRRPPAGVGAPRPPVQRAVTTTASSGEVPRDRQVDPATAQRVLAARFAPPLEQVDESHDIELPASMFHLEKPAEPLERRKISVRPIGFWTGGKGIQITIPF